LIDRASCLPPSEAKIRAFFTFRTHLFLHRVEDALRRVMF
jgi:hypothetical protein